MRISDFSRKLPDVTTVSPSARPLTDLDGPGEPFAGLDGAAGEGPLPRLDEDDRPAFVVLDGLLGDDEGPALPARRGRPLDVHPRLQPSSGVGDLDAAFDRPGRGVDDVADEDEPAAELLAGIGVGLQDDLASRLGGAEVLLLDVEAGPERRRVGQTEEARAELDGVAGDDRAFENGAREGRPDGEQGHGHGLGVEGLDLGGRDAQKLQAFAGPGEDGPGRPLLRRIAGVPPGPGGRLDVLRLHGQEIRAVDLGQELALADTVALDASTRSSRPGVRAVRLTRRRAFHSSSPAAVTRRATRRIVTTSVLMSAAATASGVSVTDVGAAASGTGGFGRRAGLGGALGAAAGDEDEGRQGGPEDDRAIVFMRFSISPRIRRRPRGRPGRGCKEAGRAGVRPGPGRRSGEGRGG